MGWKRVITLGISGTAIILGAAYSGYRRVADPDIPPIHAVVDGHRVSLEHKLYILPKHKGGPLLERGSWDAIYSELTIEDENERVVFRDHRGQRALPPCDATRWHTQEAEEITISTSRHTLRQDPRAQTWQRAQEQYQRVLRELWRRGCEPRDDDLFDPLYSVTPQTIRADTASED